MKFSALNTLSILISFFWILNGLSQGVLFTQEENEWIEKHPVIEFGYDPRWEPYEIYSYGQYGGIISEYIKIIEENTGIEMVPIPDMTWEESINGLIDGSIDFVPSCVWTPQRDKLIELSNPYILDPIVIVASKSGSYFSNLYDLKGKSIAVTEGYYAIEFIRAEYPDIRINEYKSIENCLKSLIQGKSDAFIGKLNVITYYINHYGFDNMRIVGTTPFEDNGICFGMNPEWEIFSGILNKIIAKITPEERHEIREKWIAGKGREIYSKPFFIFVLSIFIISLGLAYFWNRALKRRLIRKKKTEIKLKSLLEEVEKRNREKKVLLQEIHHRVKNNLQIVSSMLNLQANSTNDIKTTNALKEAKDRVASIALVHKKMYLSPIIELVNLKEYTESLFEDTISQFENCDNVELEVISTDFNDIKMDSIVPLALILNELITNSLKYAFHSQEQPKIKIDFRNIKETNFLRMTYSDNGSWVENQKSDRFGTSMIEIFTEQIDGTYTLIKEENCTKYIFNFKDLQMN